METNFTHEDDSFPRRKTPLPSEWASPRVVKVTNDMIIVNGCCSNCGSNATIVGWFLPSYCPHCGAKIGFTQVYYPD